LILVTHAFSRKNAGDALLVDLTIERLVRLGYDKESVVIAALDPESFSNHPRVFGVPGEPHSTVSLGTVKAAMHRIRLRGSRLDQLFTQADGVVAVGGGYLHTSGPVESIGCWLNHLGQLKLAVKSGAPTVYLPQSIGPLRGPIGASIRKQLLSVDLVAVRDDESLWDLGSRPNVRRFPDLAILELTRRISWGRTVGSEGHTIVIGRRLRSGAEYERRFRGLLERLKAPHIALQADVGPKSDALFYAYLGLEISGTLDALASRLPGGVVVSVRLHGALQALMLGWPAIHLSYDRKGWGAYSDLGLADYVHDAYRFDPDLVARQTQMLQRDASDFWGKLDRVLPAIARQDSELDQLLMRIVSGEGDAWIGSRP
jgi:polysaccharide pyruvyl transferase WcaK-like protein